jgi:PAS domain S-box-containing protein
MTKILAIDDRKDNLTILSAILKNSIPGCTIITALSGIEGLEKAAAELPDTILLDIKMPEMDGYEVCAKLKENKITRHIPVIMITAIKTESSDVSQGLNVGADAFLAKPIDESILIAQVNTALRIKKAEDQLRDQKGLLEKIVNERTSALRKSEKKYRTLLETTSEGCWQINADNKIIEVNPAACKMLGYDTEEMLGKTTLDFVDDENKKIFINQTSKISSTKHRSYEIVLKKKTGEDLPAYFNATTIRDESGKVQGAFAFISDITERKRAECRIEALLSLNQMTEASLDEIGAFALENGVKLTNSTIGYIAFVNEDETVLTMHSWSKEAMEQCKLIDRPLVYPLATVGLWGEAIRQRKPVITNNYSEPSPLKKEFPEGHINIIRHMNIPLFEGNKITAVAGVGNKEKDYDQSDIRQLTLLMQGMWRLVQRKREQEAKKELEYQLLQAQKMEAIGTLAGGIAHDFNNILSSILGYTELALDDADTETILHENLIEVLTAGNRAKDLVQQILTLSRQNSPEIKPIQINPLVQEALKMLRSTIPTSIKIKTNICSEQLVLQADPTQIHQVIVNLATNAKHAMTDATGVLTVCVDSVNFDENTKEKEMAPGDYVRITVSDTGAGIADTHLDKIFEPYFTTKKIGEGTGLGLSVVHGIVKSHKGDITVKSKLGTGTTFHVYLPLAKQQSVELPTQTDEPLPRGSERILLVDDEPSIVKMLQQSLERLGYMVTIFTSSMEALEAFRTSPDTFDLVITDMSMPTMTGDKFAEEIKKIRSDVPVILCTGFSDQIKIRTGTDMQINAFLMKPINKAKLAKTIRRVLGRTSGGL